MSSTTDEKLNRSGNLSMSPTPFRGVMALEENAPPPSVPGVASSSAETSANATAGPVSNNPQDALVESSTAANAASAASSLAPRAASPLTHNNSSSSSNGFIKAAPELPASSHTPLSPQLMRSRKTKAARKTEKHRRKRRNSKDNTTPTKKVSFFGSQKCCDRTLVRSTLSCMNLLARILVWCSAMASVATVIWYSYELKKHGTDPHLIAWFSAGAFVLLGFPISMYGIVMHLANYNQPNVQMYVVRILWMVPIYSIESWLCLRYKDYAIYIETLRDCYESYVLYSFLQFLIQVLGGEEALILMLKDKSPTRGVHMWGLQWCVKPWLMGQPLRKTYESAPPTVTTTTDAPSASSPRTLKRVHWTSPFFVKCKFGVLQYVLLKFICSIVVVILERNQIYKEGDFTPKGGYLYICILTNLSQCWALYCLIFFYYATKNELSSIRPVGKFLSVKALVFFTWWQSVMISMLYQMDLIPHYHGGTSGLGFGPIHDDHTDDAIGIESATSSSGSAFMPLSAEEALALDEYGGSVLTDSSSSKLFLGSSSSSSTSYYANMKQQQQQDWSAEDVAKGMQDYLICIEMFMAAIVHIFVFPHTEYDSQEVEARTRALNQTPHKDWNKRLGRKWKDWDNKSGWSGTTNTSSDAVELSKVGQYHHQNHHTASTLHEVGSGMSTGSFDEEDDLRIHPLDRLGEESREYGDDEEEEGDDEGRERKPLLALDPILPDTNADDDDDEDGGGSSSMYSLESSVLHDGDLSPTDGDSGYDLENPSHARAPSVASSAPSATHKPSFVRALLDSAIPQDLRDNTVGIIKGDYVVEKKTLLHHAATSDSYDLFSRVSRPRGLKPTSIYTKSSHSSD